MDKQTYEQKKLEREQKKQSREGLKFKKKIGWTFFIFGVFGLIVLAVWYYVSSQPVIEESDIISKNGIHWHPHLRIIIDGQEQEIPADIGLGAAQHFPIHTHETDGIIHLEHSGFVTKGDIKLKKFFEIWGEEFDKECIFEFCDDGQKTVKFFVNGAESQDFENYVMQDGDRIEIKYE